MAHFAQVTNGIVTQVIVADQSFIDSGAVGDPSTWIQTSYNTFGGQHRNGGTPLRKNYAGIGYIYDSGRDAFYAPSPYPSWILNENTCLWDAPVPMPTDAGTPEAPKFWGWDEPTLSWKELQPPGI